MAIIISPLSPCCTGCWCWLLLRLSRLPSHCKQPGVRIFGLAKGAKVEAGRVVWPTRQERNQTTLVVVAFVLVMAMILWGLDAFFGWLAAMIIG